MPGPPPKPLEAKRRAGNPGKRPLNALVVVPPASVERREPPAGLGAAGLAAWAVALDRAPWIGDSDIEAVRHWAMAEDRLADLRALLAEMGYVLFTDKGYAYTNPAMGALATTEDQIRKWMSLLGLTPADRSRLGVAEVKAQSALEEMMARRRG
ncbi:MAG: hypothetical protein NVS9B1_27450 [Candidatus Dormibacteraceae bacterium]